MTHATPPPLPTLIPETAPFSPEQRTWLNGFLAGLLSLDSGVNPLTAAESAALLPEVGVAAESRGRLSDGDDGQAPWHDPALPLTERMQLAESRPLRRRIMAAMGQQDCGQCGYNCEDYANAIFLKSEERLNLCVPGGKETARMLKTLYAEFGAIPAAAKPANAQLARASAPAIDKAPAPIPAHAAPAATAVSAPSRNHPAEVAFLSRTRLNKASSSKETWHVELDLADSGITYSVGDSLGIVPSNHPALVDAVIAAIGAPPDFPIADRSLREVLSDGSSLGVAPDMLFELISYITGGERRQKAKELARGADPDGDAATLDVLAALQKFPGIRPDPEAFVESLDPLQPRLYSIACSPKIDARCVALTVDAVRYTLGDRRRLGVASTFLAERIAPGAKLKAYIQKAQSFALPCDSSVPIIMIGPGTGIAPFRAFLHERRAAKAPGKNWLFFGHQRRDCDFFYEDELAGMNAAGFLTHLSLAWSRDRARKFYVQDRMREAGRDLWSWIAEGAHIYVCGAIAMGKDTERALLDIIAEHGARSLEQAGVLLAALKKSGRYQTDVY
ncbi:MAG TPA: sulfite reductase subunit alpha [Xanthobacteraceae bacterium]|jgi:sulfite reductase (NADPH) flavoprotein alpha-component|nr:sulfite reductase subunit alpha [Xanthobacteraceae bacterium]